MKFCDLDGHRDVSCSDGLMDCQLYKENCCYVGDCIGRLKRGDYEKHMDANVARSVVTSLMKRLQDTQSELDREQKKQRTEVKELPTIATTASHMQGAQLTAKVDREESASNVAEVVRLKSASSRKAVGKVDSATDVEQ
eukprot:gene43866-54502_t